tara:strand:+ start:3266 stop:3385 length:120 start_codon:yes stop_codon:yes gene_type:complete
MTNRSNAMILVLFSLAAALASQYVVAFLLLIIAIKTSLN